MAAVREDADDGPFLMRCSTADSRGERPCAVAQIYADFPRVFCGQSLCQYTLTRMGCVPSRAAAFGLIIAIQKILQSLSLPSSLRGSLVSASDIQMRKPWRLGLAGIFLTRLLVYFVPRQCVLRWLDGCLPSGLRYCGTRITARQLEELKHESKYGNPAGEGKH